MYGAKVNMILRRLNIKFRVKPNNYYDICSEGDKLIIRNSYNSKIERVIKL